MTLSAFMVALGNGVRSQSWDFGIKGGPVFSNINSTAQFDESDRKGYHIGLFARRKITKKGFLESGVLYAAQGTRLERISPRIGNEIEWKINVNYIRIPLTFNLRPVSFLQFSGGLYTAYLAGVSSSREGSFFNSFNEVDRNNVNEFDFGAVLGSSFLVKSLSAGISWHLGFSQLTREEFAPLLGDSVNNRGIIVYVAYIFPLNKI